ncbi:MAG: adenylyl-sulfate kinase [Candidatus Thioglobus sp.]|jgi:adenylylsulfate kinase
MTNSNIIWHDSTVTREHRNQQNKHKSIVLWFTGLSGSGKSTLAHAVEEKLHQIGCRTIVLDGDNVRHGLCDDLTFTDSDRTENMRRIGELSKLFIEAGVITLTAFISPFKQDREKVRNLVSHDDFLEVFVDCSIEVCQERDVKGMYKRAMAGEILNFTGISSPYEAPNNAELVIKTDDKTLEESVNEVMKVLFDRGIIVNEN